MDIIRNKVIIWGTDDYNTLAMIRQVGQGTRNIFFLINGRAKYAALSKYCLEYKESYSLDEALNYLENNFDCEPVKPIIITSGDGISVYIDRNKHKLADRYILPGTKHQGDLEKFTDKFMMTQLAEQIGIDVPKSKLVMFDTDVGDIEYPCFIKPSHQKYGHYNEFKFKYCKSAEELKHILKHVRHDSVFIVQQYIKKEKDLLVYGCRTPNGETLIAGGLMTDRFAVGNGSSYGKVDSAIHPSIDVEKIKMFLDTINYVGLFSFEYGLMGDRAYFFETNLRNDGTSHFFFQAGANIPLAYIVCCSGGDYSSVAYRVTRPCYYMDEIFDIANVIQGNVRKKDWQEQVKKVSAFKFYDAEDLRPYEKAKKNRYLRIFRDIIIKRYRMYLVIILEKFGLRK